MSSKVSLKVVLKNGLLIVVGMLLGVFLLGERPFTSQTVNAEAQEISAPLSADSPTAETWINCTPTEVVNYHNRVHVRCAAAVGNISYFAVPTDNPAHAARILSTLSVAQIAGRTLSILYDPNDTSGTDFGCLAADCRVLIATGFGQ